MQHFCNQVLKGRAIAMTVTKDTGVAPMNVAEFFIVAIFRAAQETREPATHRKYNKLLDVLEPQRDLPCLELEVVDWTLLKPEVFTLATTFGIHSTFLTDQLSDLEKGHPAMSLPDGKGPASSPGSNGTEAKIAAEVGQAPA